MSPRSTRRWWFEVDHVWGYEDQECPVVIGTVLLDRYNASPWNIMNVPTATMIGGWTGRRLGEATGEWADKPNPAWLSPLGKIEALAEDHPERIEAERVLHSAYRRSLR